MRTNYLFFFLGLLLLVFAVVFADKIKPLQPYTNASEPTSLALQLPRAQVRATVVSLTSDTNISCEGTCPPHEYPRDTGVLRIDEVKEVTNPSNITLSGIEAGRVIAVEFAYSARPAKIHPVVSGEVTTSPDEGDDGVVSKQTNPETLKPITKVDGYYIFPVESAQALEEEDTLLPGLQVGTTIETTLDIGWVNGVLVGNYTIVR